MKRANYIISVVMAGIGILFLTVGRQYSSAALDAESSAATWPTILSWILIGLAVILAITNTISKDIPESGIDFRGAGFRAVLMMIGIVLTYLVSYCFLGCLITNGIFIPILLYFLGERNWKVIVIYDVAVLAAVYLLFEVLLSSKLAPAFFM